MVVLVGSFVRFVIVLVGSFACFVVLRGSFACFVVLRASFACFVVRGSLARFLNIAVSAAPSPSFFLSSFFFRSSGV